MSLKAQIIATIGPASSSQEILTSMVKHGMDVARLNFSWGDEKNREAQITLMRKVGKELNKRIIIIEDLPGPRIQEDHGHTYDHNMANISSLTAHDREFIKFGIKQGVDYFALSFVGSAVDVKLCRDVIKSYGGKQKIIAKIERKIALESLDKIIKASDAIMIARGDLGNEIPLEEIPFVEAKIIRKCKKAGKPVITATQMMLSMTENPLPTRAEVTDVAGAIILGSDAVMLSEESAVGKYPVQTVSMMEKIIGASLRHMGNTKINQLVSSK